jgi:hypothetical protein
MNKTALSRLTAIFILFLFTSVGFAQEKNGITYSIIKNGNVTDVIPYVTALNKSNMRYHRLREKRNIIVFDTGLTVELYSANEIAANGVKCNPAEYPLVFAAEKKSPVFSLGPNSFILEKVEPQFKHN